MSAFERALQRARRETGTLPESMSGAAAWLETPSGAEDIAIAPGLLDGFAREGREEARKDVREDVNEDVGDVGRDVRREVRDEPREHRAPVFEFPQPQVAQPQVAQPQVAQPQVAPRELAEPELTQSAAFAAEAPVAEPARPRDIPSAEMPPARVRPAEARPPEVHPADRDTKPRETRRLFNGFNPQLAGMVVSGPQMDHATTEQYGRLAAVLHHAQIERRIKTVMVTSAMASEGKTLTALNLALTLSESYNRRVVFIDADLRCSRVHELLNVVRVTGLSEALEDGGQMQARVIEVSPKLSVLLAGCSNLDPKGALTSQRMGQVLSEAAATFDWVIVDTPPVVLLPDTNLLARMVDAAIFVVRAGRTSYDVVDRAIQTLDRKRVLGVVLNDVQDAEALQYYEPDYRQRDGATK